MPDSFVEQRAVSHWVDRIIAREKRDAKHYPKEKPCMIGSMEWRAYNARTSKPKPVTRRKEKR